MYRSTWNRWLKTLDGRSRTWRRAPRRLILTNLESRDVPAAFTPGDIVVYRVGPGTGTGGALVAAAAQAAFLDEYSPTGTLVQSIALPTATSGSNLALTASGTLAGTTILGDGSLTNSTDGRYLFAVGYDSPVGTAGVVGQATPRVVGIVGANGVVNTTTGIGITGSANTTSGFYENNIDDATSPDGVAIFAGGFDSSGSIRETLAGTNGPATAINTGATGTVNGFSFSKSNARDVSVANNQLYGVNGTTNIDGPFTTGTGLPTTSGQISNILPGFPTTGTDGAGKFPSPYQYIFDGPDTLYVADSRTDGFGGLQKWVLGLNPSFPSNWGLDYTIQGEPIPNTAGVVIGTTTQAQQYEGLVALTGNFSGTNPILYGITSETTATNQTSTGTIPQNSFVKFVDMGSAGASTETVLQTAPLGEYYRGTALAPTPLGTTSDTVGISSSPSGTAPINTPVTFTATVTSGATGYITFVDTTTGATLGVVPLSGNQAQLTTSSLGVNNNLPQNIEAIYGGDSTYLTNSNSTSYTITGTPTTMVLTSSNLSTQSPSAGAVTVTFTATVSPSSAAANGTITFYDNGLPINTTPIIPNGSGVATVTETTNALQGVNPAVNLTPGSHTITAVFTPTAGASYLPSNQALVQSVAPNAFGAGDLLIQRDGDGTTLLTPGGAVTGDVVYMDEYTPAGVLKQSIVMPTSSVAGGNQPLVSAGYQSGEGELTLSSDGQYVLFSGYDTAPGASPPYGTDTIGRISYNGTINTSMAVTDASPGNSVRGVASPDGNQIYVTGAAGGVRYVSSYTAGTTTSIAIDSATTASNGGTPLNFSDLYIAGGQLYVTDASTTVPNPTYRVATVGTGLPTTTGQSDAGLPGIPDPTTSEPGNPVGIWFTKLQMGPTVGPDTMYIADDGANFFGGTITKWSLVSGTWMLDDTIASGGTTATSPVPSFDNVNGVTSSGTVNLYATYGNSGSNTGGGDLFSIVDTGGYNMPIPSHTINTVASVSTTSNEVFRGIVPVPTQALTVASITPSDGVPADGTTQRSEVRQIAVTFSGPVTFAGTGTVNQNAAAAFQLNQINDTATHFATPVAVANLAAAVSTNGSGQTVVTLTFSTTGNTNAGNTGPIDSFSAQNGAAPSLNDGRFQLTITSADVTGPTGPLDGGGAGGNYVSPLDTQGGGAGQVGLYRLYGDGSGDTPGIDDQLALGTFRGAFNSSSTGPTSGSYLAYLDSDNSGVIDQIDLAQFRQRFNAGIFV